MKRCHIQNICSLSVLLIFLLGLAACTKQEYSDIAQDLDYLCAQDCYGRLPGTDGNVKTQNYIAEEFEEAGLSFYGEYTSYLIPYNQNVFDSLSDSQVLTLEYIDGTTEHYYSGIDFYPYLCTNSSFTATPNLNVGTDSTEVVFCIDSGLFAGKDIVFTKSDKATSRISTDPEPLPFLCNEALFNKIASAQRITFQDNLEIQYETVNNVVGVLEGSQRDSAIIIGAHYDHVGGYGQTYYPGALDNASGVSALLKIIKELGNTQFNFDVVFVAFNGEEMGQLGSQAFVEIPFPYEEMIVVNIDSIADKGGSGIQIVGDRGLQQILEQVWKQENVQTIVNSGNILGDHTSFQTMGIPAVTISSSTSIDEILEKSHIPSDHIDNIDVAQIDYVAQAVIAFMKGTDSVESILENIVTLAGNMSADNDADMTYPFDQAMDVIAELKPDFDEVVSFEFNGDTYLARDISPYKNVLAMKHYDSTFDVPDQVGDFSLQLEYPMIHLTGPNIDENLGICVYFLIGNQQYLPGQKYPLPEEFQQHMLEFSYKNSSGEQLMVFLKDKTSYSIEDEITGWDEVETISVEGGTLFIQNQLWNDGEMFFRGIVYTNPESPWDLFLLKHDLFSGITYEDIMGFYSSVGSLFMKLPLTH